MLEKEHNVYRVCIILGTIFIIAGFYRMSSMVAHTPVLGYANNYDMIRVQGCFHIWPAGVADPYAKSARAPLPVYKVEKKIPGGCYFSSELLLVAPVYLYARTQPNHEFPLQMAGFFKAAIWLIAVSGVAFVLFRERNAAVFVLHGVLVWALVFDPANTLYLNTFYAESSSFFFLYCALNALYFAATGSSKRRQFYFLLSLILLGFSKQQSLGVAVAIAMSGFCLFALRKAWRSAVVLVFAFVAVCILQAMNFSRMTTIQLANATDTYLGAILPNVDDKASALQLLGLPERCATAIGMTWYTPGVSTSHPCPEVGKVRRVKLLTLFLFQPKVLPVITNIGLSQTRPWMLGYLGHIAGKRFGKVKNFSFDKIVVNLPDNAWRGVFVFPAVVCMAALMLFREKIAGRPFWLMVTTISLSMYAAFYSSLLGDGFFDLSKHNYLFFNLMLSFYLIVLMRCIYCGVSLVNSKWQLSWQSR